MTTWAFFNTINADGTGDFTHFYDIIKTLRNDSEFEHIEFIALICFNSPLDRPQAYQRIAHTIDEELKSIGITCYFGSHDDHETIFSQDTALQEQLNIAEQAIIISFDNLFHLYKDYFKKTTPIKSIGEHEMIRFGYGACTSLGLRAGCHGIKVSRSIVPITPSAAWAIIQENSPAFATSILHHSNTEDFDDFRRHNRIVPAYFNYEGPFGSFMNGLVNNRSFLNGKDLVIYHSGFNFTTLLQSEDIRHLTYSKNYNRIEIISPDQERVTIDGDTTKTNVIRIFTGFNLNDLSYQAIFSLGDKVAGVSGDNSFELCVALGVLPIYWSTNMTIKIQTIRALTTIIQSSCLAKEVKREYEVFFNLHAMNNKSMNADLNFPLLIENWQAISQLIRDEHNFYDQLNAIVKSHLPDDEHDSSFRFGF